MMNKKTVVVAGATVGAVGVGAIAYKLIKMNKLKKQQESQATTDNETQENVTTNETEVEDVPGTNNKTQEEKVVHSEHKDAKKDASKYIASWLRVGNQLYYENDLDKFYQCLLTLGLIEEDALAIKNIARTGDYYIENDMREFSKK